MNACSFLLWCATAFVAVSAMARVDHLRDETARLRAELRAIEAERDAWKAKADRLRPLAEALERLQVPTATADVEREDL